MSEYWEELVYIFGLVFCMCGGYVYVFCFVFPSDDAIF